MFVPLPLLPTSIATRGLRPSDTARFTRRPPSAARPEEPQRRTFQTAWSNSEANGQERIRRSTNS